MISIENQRWSELIRNAKQKHSHNLIIQFLVFIYRNNFHEEYKYQWQLIKSHN